MPERQPWLQVVASAVQVTIAVLPHSRWRWLGSTTRRLPAAPGGSRP